MAKREITYKEAIFEIEAILNKLNSGEGDIDTISQDVKRATELAALCKSRLNKSEAEIKKLFEE